MDLSVKEDETDDLADDIKGAAPKKTEAPVNSDADSDIPDDIKTNNTKKTDPDTSTKEKPKTSVTDKYKVNMGLDVSNKSNKSSYSAYTTLFIEALNSLDAMAALGVSVDPEAPAIKNYKTDRYDIATSVDKTAEGLKKAWNKIYSIAGTWPPSGKGITGIIQTNLKSNDVYKKYFEERKKLDAELNGTPKMKQEVYNTQLADLKKKYSEMIDPKQIMTLGKINNAIGLYRTAIDKFRQGADAELGFVEKREGGIKGEDLAKVEALQKTIEDDKIPKQDRISAAEKLKKDFPAYFGNVKTGDIINGAIGQIKSGLSEAPENFYEELSDAISNIVLTKKEKLDDKKEESENWVGPQERILEDFAGFLNANKAFATGVGRGIVDGFKGGPKDKSVKGGEDKASLLYAADAIKGSLAGLASEIDNVIAFKKNIKGLGEGLPDEYFEQKKKLDAKLNGTPPLERDDYAKQLADLKSKYTGSTDNDTDKLARKASNLTADEAKAEAGEMISFVQDSFKYVVNISKELESSSVNLSSIKKKLDDISKQLNVIGRKGGILEKWKNDVLGESRERVASTSYLEKGRALMQMAGAKAAEVNSQQAIEKRYRDRDADVVIKKAVDMVSGSGEGVKPSKIKKKGDVTVFSKDDKNANKEVIKTFQQRLIDLGHLPTGNLNGEFDEETKNASKIAMTYLGTLSGKVYADNAEAFQDFQRDLGFYNDNKDEIKKKMGL
jgi:hypothetical protein